MIYNLSHINYTSNSMGLENDSRIFSLVVILTAKDKLQMAISHEISLFVSYRLFNDLAPLKRLICPLAISTIWYIYFQPGDINRAGFCVVVKSM